MENYLTNDQHELAPTQVSVRSWNLWRNLRQVPRMILGGCLALPFAMFLIHAVVVTVQSIADMFNEFPNVHLSRLCFVAVIWVLPVILFWFMRIVLVPSGRLLRRGRLERKIETTTDRHQIVHLLVKLASINDRLGRRVVAQYYRQSTLTLFGQPLDKPLVPIPKAELFKASLDCDGLSNFGWLTLTPYHLAHETDILCRDDVRVVIRLEDIRKVEVNRQGLQAPRMTVEFECAGEVWRIHLSPISRLEFPTWRYTRTLTQWKDCIEEGIELRKRAAEQHKAVTLAIRTTDECSD